MKKQNLKSLKLNKKSISNLEPLNEIKGGARQGALPKSMLLLLCPSIIICNG